MFTLQPLFWQRLLFEVWWVHFTPITLIYGVPHLVKKNKQTDSWCILCTWGVCTAHHVSSAFSKCVTCFCSQVIPPSPCPHPHTPHGVNFWPGRFWLSRPDPCPLWPPETRAKNLTSRTKENRKSMSLLWVCLVCFWGRGGAEWQDVWKGFFGFLRSATEHPTWLRRRTQSAPSAFCLTSAFNRGFKKQPPASQMNNWGLPTVPTPDPGGWGGGRTDAPYPLLHFLGLWWNNKRLNVLIGKQ